MKKLVLLFLSILCVYNLTAQNTEYPKVLSGIDLGIGVGSNNAISPSLAWSRTHALGKKQKVRLGYGVRFHAFSGNDLNYTTAPANLIADGLVDTIFISNISTMGVSATLQASYYFNPKWAFDFNIDVIGFGFGPSQTATGSSVVGSVDVAPTSLNLLIAGPYDIGQLKANFAVSYLVSDNIRLRLGADMQVSEYTTAIELNNENDRFRIGSAGFFIGGSYYLN